MWRYTDRKSIRRFNATNPVPDDRRRSSRLLVAGMTYLTSHRPKTIETRGLERAGKGRGTMKGNEMIEETEPHVTFAEKIVLTLFVGLITFGTIQFAVTHYEIKRVASVQEVGK
jgi:hypothetical protein